MTTEEKIKKLKKDYLPQIKKVDIIDTDKTGYISAFFQYVYYQSLIDFKETIISEYLYKCQASTFYIIRKATHSDGIDHYPPNYY